MQLQPRLLPSGGSLPGLSEKVPTSHHQNQNNYGVAVRRLNAIRAELSQRPPASRSGFVLDWRKSGVR